MMKRLIVMGILYAVAMTAHATEILTWDRTPLKIALNVGEERIIFVDKNVRVGMAAEVAERLHIQTAQGTLYVTALAPLTTRVQVKDAQTSEVMLIDFEASAKEDGDGDDEQQPPPPPPPPQQQQQQQRTAPLPPIRIVTQSQEGNEDEGQSPNDRHLLSRSTPMPILLTRYCAQQLYAPFDAVEPLPGVKRLPVDDQTLIRLLPTKPIEAKPIIAFRLADTTVTGVKLTNRSLLPQTLHFADLNGRFMAATFQHSTLGAAGDATDTTVVYLVFKEKALSRVLPPGVMDSSSTPALRESHP